METWLLCTLMPGQFSSEHAALGLQATGDEFGVFIPKDVVQVKRAPTRDSPGEGLVKVEPWGSKGDLVVVRLPGQTVDGRQYITVKASQLETGDTPSTPRG